MSNPNLVEITRGGIVESRHEGSVAVCDSDGRLVFSIGDVDRPVYPRSAVKAFQALALIESGAADRLGLDDADIALAVSSHGGEPRHVAGAIAMLAKAGRDVGTLECGVHAPSYRKAADALVRAGERPSALHNNCSGKHSGFICLACAEGHDPAGYINATHPTMCLVMETVGEMTGTRPAPEMTGLDGCSIPTQAAPLAALARGFARFGTGQHLGPKGAAAAARIRKAVAADPFLVAGTGRFDTEIMQLLGARVFTKGGAEGVSCAALPELGLGVAIKCDDGAGRAAEVVATAVIAKFLPLSEEERGGLESHLRPVQRNWNGIDTGRLQPTGALA